MNNNEIFHREKHNILIITHGRSGSTNFFNAITSELGIYGWPEPFNNNLWKNEFKQEPPSLSLPIRKGICMKEILQDNGEKHNAHDWLQTNFKEFDFVIVLIRDNMYDAMISSQNALKYGFHDEYEATEKVDIDTTFYILNAYDTIIDFYMKNNDKISLVWYSDIYSSFDKMSATMDRLDLGFTEENKKNMWNKYLNKELRYRKK